MITSKVKFSTRIFTIYDICGRNFKMKESRRQKKVARLIQEALSQTVTEFIQASVSSLITITRVEISSDLKAAHVFLSVFDQKESEQILELLEKRKGFLRKSVASKTKLKYNPTLFFSLDPVSDYEDNIDRILKRIKNENPSD